MHHHSPNGPLTPTTYTEFGRHRFRAPVGVVIDAPIPITHGWVGTIWANHDPAPDRPAWERFCWIADTQTGRGWLIPDRLAVADIIEFGSDPTGAHRWYGLVDSYEPGLWLNLTGPYPTPNAAQEAAERLIAINCHTAAPNPAATGRRTADRCRNHRTRRHGR